MMAFGTVDDSEFQAFAAKAKSKIEAQELKHQVELSVKRVGTQLTRGVKSRTPVDTGNLRRNWNVRGPMIRGLSISIEAVNNAEYASYVENGHRTKGGKGWVEGHFMLKDSIDEITNQMPQLLTPVLNNFLKGLM